MIEAVNHETVGISVVVHLHVHIGDWCMMVSTYETKCVFTHCEQWSNVNIEAEISESCSDDLVSSVVTILSDFSYQDTRSPTFFLFKFLFVFVCACADQCNEYTYVFTVTNHSLTHTYSITPSHPHTFTLTHHHTLTSTLFKALSMSSDCPYSDTYAPLTICGEATWRPWTFSNASDISPTVHRARVALIDRSSRFPSKMHNNDECTIEYYMYVFTHVHTHACTNTHTHTHTSTSSTLCKSIKSFFHSLLVPD